VVQTGAGLDGQANGGGGGGVEEAERLYKKRWRKHFNAAKERRLSRNRLIVVEGIGSYMEREGVESVQACDDLDIVFAEVEYKLAPMVAKLREIGLARAAKPRKPRKKRS
jgi:hypothetical protein